MLPAPAVAQLYFGLYGGAAFVHDAETQPGSLLFENLSNEALEDGVIITSMGLELSDTEFDAGWLLGGRVGYWLESLPFLAIEGELYSSFPKLSNQTVTVDTTLTADGTMGQVDVPVQVREADIETLTIGLNLLARYPYGRIQPYGGAGVGLVRGTVENVKLNRGARFTIDGTTFNVEAGQDFYKLSGEDDWVWALQAMGGVRGFIGEKVALFVEYKYVNTKFELPPVDIDYDVSHVIGGIEFFLGPGPLQPPPP